MVFSFFFLWVWMSDPRTSWFRCFAPNESPYWDHCQYYVHLCTHCLRVDRGHDPFHSYPCCGMYGRFLDDDPLRRMCVGLHRWVSQTLLVSRSSTWVVTNPLSGDAIGGPLVLHHLRTCCGSCANSIHLFLSRS